MRRLLIGCGALASLILGGCSSIGSLTGAITGGAAGGGSANPAVGYAVGLGSKAATDALVKYLSRKRHEKEQDALVAVVGGLGEGEAAPWSIHHQVPLFDDAHGHVTLIRSIPNALSPCKEVVFVVLSGKDDSPRGQYVTTFCQGADGWSWAQAEPASARWGSLQ